MLTLPIPMIVALLLAFMLARTLLLHDRPPGTVWLLAACIFQGIVVSLVQYYGAKWLLPLQPVSASLIPVTAYAAFVATTQRRFRRPADFLHFIVPAFIAFCVTFAPETIDFIVPLVFISYAFAILVDLRPGADRLLLARLETGDWPARIWRAIAIALLVSALSDGLIFTFMTLGLDWARPIVISIGSSLSLLLLGAFSLSQMLENENDENDEPATETAATEENETVIVRLHALLENQALYKDPDLTLAKLARRLGLPAKQLSIAINRVTGESVSRHVNAFRINAACALLKGGVSVTEAMLASGFNTKSNFNREFLRITGKTPSAWKMDQTA